MFDILKWVRERGAKLPAKDTQLVDKALDLKPGTAAAVNEAAVEGAIDLTEAQVAGLTTSATAIG